MGKFVIIQKSSPIYRFSGIVFGLILLILNLISMFYRVQLSQYDFLFYCYLFLVLVGLFIFIRFAFLTGDKEILSVDNDTVWSKIPKSSFSINWADVSRVQLDDDQLIFFLNADRKKKHIMLDSISYTDATKLMRKIREIAFSKNIMVNTLKPTEEKEEANSVTKGNFHDKDVNIE